MINFKSYKIMPVHFFNIKFNDDMSPAEILINVELVHGVKYEELDLEESKGFIVIKDKEMLMKFLKVLFRSNSVTVSYTHLTLPTKA